jgi:predicted GIY-YIG superfamily endonuclease
MSSDTAPSNTLLAVYPQWAHLLLEVDPSTVTVKSSRVLLFGCDRGHAPKRAAVSSRTRSWEKGVSGCFGCSRKGAEPGVNDLATVYPQWSHLLLEEDPSTVSVQSSRVLLFGCDKGHAPKRVSVGGRTKAWAKGVSGCPICSGNEVETGVNDIATVYPQWAHLLLEDDPSTIKIRSGKKLMFGCTKGHVPRKAYVSHRTKAWDRGLSGCPVCSGCEVEPGVTDLATVYPQWAHLLLEDDPSTVAVKSNRSLLFGCDNGHAPKRVEVSSRTQAWARGVSGCPVCAGNEVEPGINDVATVYPQWSHLLLEDDPSTVAVKSNRSLLFGCDNGHTPRLSVVHDRTKSWGCGFSGCPVCSGWEVEPGVNDIATLHPQWAHLLLEDDPSTVAVKSHRKLLFGCDRGHAPRTSLVYNRVRAWDNGNSGCLGCATSGFNTSKRGWLYLICNESCGLLQVGITNYLQRRLTEHKRTGFVNLLDTQEYDVGVDAKSWEDSIKDFLAEHLGHSLSARINAAKFKGFTESWLMSELNVTTLLELQEMVRSTDRTAV